MTEQKKLQEIISNITSITKYINENNVLEYYFKKLKIKVLDFCNREDLNDPLLDFIEDRLFSFAKKEMEKTKNNTSINGINMKDIKSISRGDTSITLKDNKGTEDDNVLSLLNFNSKDLKILTRHRKVF